MKGAVSLFLAPRILSNQKNVRKAKIAGTAAIKKLGQTSHFCINRGWICQDQIITPKALKKVKKVATAARVRA